jgi:hypothetical protein
LSLDRNRLEIPGGLVKDKRDIAASQGDGGDRGAWAEIVKREAPSFPFYFPVLKMDHISHCIEFDKFYPKHFNTSRYPFGFTLSQKRGDFKQKREAGSCLGQSSKKLKNRDIYYIILLQ